MKMVLNHLLVATLALASAVGVSGGASISSLRTGSNAVETNSNNKNRVFDLERLGLVGSVTPTYTYTSKLQTMDGDLKIQPGWYLYAGFNLPQVPSSVQSVTVPYAAVTFVGQCEVAGQVPTPLQQTVCLTSPLTYSSFNWAQSQSWQLAWAPSACAGVFHVTSSIQGGAYFQGAFETQNGGDAISVQWHYYAGPLVNNPGFNAGWSSTDTTTTVPLS